MTGKRAVCIPILASPLWPSRVNTRATRPKSRSVDAPLRSVTVGSPFGCPVRLKTLHPRNEAPLRRDEAETRLVGALGTGVFLLVLGSMPLCFAPSRLNTLHLLLLVASLRPVVLAVRETMPLCLSFSRENTLHSLFLSREVALPLLLLVAPVDVKKSESPVRLNTRHWFIVSVRPVVVLPVEGSDDALLLLVDNVGSPLRSPVLLNTLQSPRAT